MNWPQYAYLALTLAGTVRSIYNAAHMRTAYTATIELTATALSTGLVLWLLWAGGFFAQG